MAYGNRKNKLREGDAPGQDEQSAARKRLSVKAKIAKATAKSKQKTEIDRTHGLTLRGEEKTIKVSRIHPNPWNPNRMAPFAMDKLRENIRTFGFIDPVLVRSGNEQGPFKHGGYEIIDGEQRFTAAKAEGLKKVKVTDIGLLSDESAKVLTINFNDLRGKHDRDAVAAIVGELSKIDGGEELLGLLPFDDAELNSLQTLNAADFDALDQLPPDEHEPTGGKGADDEDEDDLASILELDQIKPRAAAELAARLEGLREYLSNNPQTDAKVDKPGGMILAMLSATEAHYDIVAQPSDPEPVKKSKKKKKPT